MKYILISSFLIFSFCLSFSINVYAQDDPPPPVAMPKKQNLRLINELIEVVDFKNLFRTYCIWRISNESKKNNWSDAKIKEIAGSIDFRYFEWVVQSAFASYSKKELQNLIDGYKKDCAKCKIENVIINDRLVRSNLENFSVELIKGSYVMPISNDEKGHR